jgi:carboxylesterase
MGLDGAPQEAISAWSAQGSGENSKVGIVLVHGFTSTPSVMRPWAEFLNGHGFTVSVPLLPGHGTSLEDLENTTWQQWPREIEIHLIQLLDKCEKVFIFGFSMGGAASLQVAARYQSQLAGLILVNPMIHRAGGWPIAVKFASRFIKSIATAGSDIKKLGVVQWKYDRTPLRAAHQLLLLLEHARPQLEKINLPLLLLRSTEDHTLPSTNSRIILDRIGSRIKEEVVLENSYHVAPLDHDQELIFKNSLSFMEKISRADG